MKNRFLIFTIGDLLLGVLAVSLQISTYALYGVEYKADVISSGIWGGAIFLVTATLSAMEKQMPKKGIKIAAIASILAGLIIMGLYSWRMSDLVKAMEPLNGKCKLTVGNGTINICDQVAIAALFIVDGILAALLNSGLLYKLQKYI